MVRRIALVALAASLAIPLSARAQVTGSMIGTVVDSSGNPLAGVFVRAVSPTQVESTVTTARGHFAFVSLAPDRYTIQITKQGYRPASEPGIVVFSGYQVALTMRMQPALRSLSHTTIHDPDPLGLPRPRQTSDAYLLNRGNTPFYDSFDLQPNWLWFVPGVTPGAGIVMIH